MLECLHQQRTREFAGPVPAAQPLLYSDLGNWTTEDSESSSQLRKRAPVALVMLASRVHHPVDLEIARGRLATALVARLRVQGAGGRIAWW